jgi:glutamine synthetase
VHKNAVLLRGSVAHAGNDHRLGANEAPPAIISIFLGDQLTDIFEQIAKGGAKNSKQPGVLTVGVDTLPPLPKDAGDRNRTSPFAFTGNKFEFRAVGSSQSVSGPLVILNTIMAESLDYIATELESRTKDDKKKLNAAIQDVLQQIITDHGSIIFNGDNYCVEWHAEAEIRGLPNLRNTVDAIAAMDTKENAELMAKYNVLSEREFKSRNEIYLERYVKEVSIESKLTLRIAKTMIFPAAVDYQSKLSTASLGLKSLGKDHCTTVLDELNGLMAKLQPEMARLESAIHHEAKGSILDHAKHMRDEVLPIMRSVRKIADKMECIVADELWPLPTYQEILFIK